MYTKTFFVLLLSCLVNLSTSCTTTYYCYKCSKHYDMLLVSEDEVECGNKLDKTMYVSCDKACSVSFEYQVPNDDYSLMSNFTLNRQATLHKLNIRRNCMPFEDSEVMCASDKEWVFETKEGKESKHLEEKVKCTYFCNPLDKRQYCNEQQLVKILEHSHRYEKTPTKCHHCIPDKNNKCSNRKINKGEISILCDGLCYVKIIISDATKFERGCLPLNLKGPNSLYSEFPGIKDSSSSMTLGLPYSINKASSVYYNLCKPREHFNKLTNLNSNCNGFIENFNYNDALDADVIETFYPNRVGSEVCMYCYEEIVKGSETRTGNCHTATLKHKNFDEVLCQEHCATYIYITQTKVTFVRGCDYGAEHPLIASKPEADNFLEKVPNVFKRTEKPCEQGKGGYCTYKCSGNDHCNTVTIKVEDIQYAPEDFNEDAYLQRIQYESIVPTTTTTSTVPTVSVPTIKEQVKIVKQSIKEAIITTDEKMKIIRKEDKDKDDNTLTALWGMVMLILFMFLVYIYINYSSISKTHSKVDQIDASYLGSSMGMPDKTSTQSRDYSKNIGQSGRGYIANA